MQCGAKITKYERHFTAEVQASLLDSPYEDLSAEIGHVLLIKMAIIMLCATRSARNKTA